MIDRKFPIGRFVLQEVYTKEEIRDLCQIISKIPSEFKQVAANLSDDELGKTYREGSWNIRQLVHHVADIALLHYLRMKKALTEADQSNFTMIWQRSLKFISKQCVKSRSQSNQKVIPT